ncbi:TPA: hypothetical protein DF272_06370 [Candidatus Falkowbacteria bacterium]|nr:hypothetical protein [Candidatus Falkowbacteria bacterium]
MNYTLLIIPLTAAIVAQIIKIIIFLSKRQFSWKEFNSYGGMPSSHTAMVISLSAAAGYYDGWDSAIFALAIVFSLIVLRDAVGFRRQIGLHAQTINLQISRLPHDKNYQYQYLNERVGHTYLEVFAGMVVGLLITALYILFLG